MGLDAKKFNKLAKKAEKKLIGAYGSSKGLGQDLVVKKHSYTTDDYGKKTETYLSKVEVKGIVVRGVDLEFGQIQNLIVQEGEVRLYIPIDTEVEDTETTSFTFTFNSKIYRLVRKNDIGQVANITGVVREIIIKPDPKVKQ